MLGTESHVLQQFLSVLLLGNTEKGWPGRILQMGFFFKVGIQPKEIKSWMTGGQSGALPKVWPLSCSLIYGKAQVAGKLLQSRNVWRNWLIYGKACPGSRAWTNPGWTLKQPGNSCYHRVTANSAKLPLLPQFHSLVTFCLLILPSPFHKYSLKNFQQNQCLRRKV